MLPTDSAITQTTERASVEAFLARADVAQALEAHGVSSADALARVATMSDEEISELNGRIDQLPAGGDILGIIFTVFIILRWSVGYAMVSSSHSFAVLLFATTLV